MCRHLWFQCLSLEPSSTGNDFLFLLCLNKLTIGSHASFGDPACSSCTGYRFCECHIHFQYKKNSCYRYMLITLPYQIAFCSNRHLFFEAVLSLKGHFDTVHKLPLGILLDHASQSTKASSAQPESLLLYLTGISSLYFGIERNARVLCIFSTNHKHTLHFQLNISIILGHQMGIFCFFYFIFHFINSLFLEYLLMRAAILAYAWNN